MKLKKIFKSIFAGKNHIYQRKPCQDYASYRLSKDNYPVMCLSDGAGGAKYAELASKANVDAVLNLFQKISVSDFLKYSPRERKQLVVDECRGFLHNLALKYGIDDLNQLSATLVMVIVTEEKIYVGHIGDGIVTAKRNDKIIFLSAPENIDGASNRTHFTCENGAHRYYKEDIYSSHDYSSIMLCSDGPYNDISACNELKPTLLGILNDIESSSITNDIEFSKKILSAAEIYDDWSILAFSIKEGNIAEHQGANTDII